MNSYSYAGNNPITKSDPTGKWYKEFFLDNITTLGHGQSWSSFQGELGQATIQLTQDSRAWNFAVDHPVAAGIMTAGAAIPAVMAGEAAAAAYGMATFPGVGATFATQQAIATTVYSGLTLSSTLAVPKIVGAFGKADTSKPSSFYPAAWTATKEVGPSLVGGHVGAISDAMQIGGIIGNVVSNFVNNLFSSNNSQKSSSNTKDKQ